AILDAAGYRQHRISGPLWYAGRVLLIALPMLALTYAIFSDALAPYLAWLLLALMGTLVSTGLVLNAVVGERGRAFEALAQALKTLKEEAIRDPLTNLYNRRFLRDYLPRELLRAAREGIRVAVIMIDLDRFKRVNDTAGHAAGDFEIGRASCRGSGWGWEVELRRERHG